MKKLYFLIALFCGNLYGLYSQCSSGEVEFTMEVHTDTYGYEGYWELVPGTGSCGTGTITSGGNNAVGCTGGGAKAVSSGGYGNNQQISVPVQCLNQGNTYTIHYRDDWGDGGFEFIVKINGYTIAVFEGKAANETFTFNAAEPVQYDLGLTDIDKPYGYIQQVAADVEVHVFNYGRDTIKSLSLAYQVGSNPPVSSLISGLSVHNYSEDHVIHSTPWIPSANGIYSLKVWIEQVNGTSDMINSNDTLTKQVEIGPGTQNIIDSYLSSVPVITEIGNSSDLLNKPTDLDFHPNLSRKELWVVSKRTENQGGGTTIFYDAGTTNQYDEFKVDGNAWHFMSLPTGIAFSENTNFATSPGVYDANHNGGQPFTGPALWSSDPAVYAQPSGGNGSHLDMLHESPECQGIAHEKGNAFWVFDGYNGDIVRYDFVDDHGPGNDDHSDGIVWRYSDVAVSKDPADKVVSHLVYDKTSDWLYVVDYGNQRVFRIDIKTGNKGSTPSFGPFEALAEYVHISNYSWEVVADSGLVEPAGIDLIDNRLLVSDYATGDVIIYDISSMPATELGRLATGAQGIMGVKIGPEGKIWYVDHDANTVNRIDQSGIGIRENLLNPFKVYPNPSNGIVSIKGTKLKGTDLLVFSSTGKLVYKQKMLSDQEQINLEQLPDGVYSLQIRADQNVNIHTQQLLMVR